MVQLQNNHDNNPEAVRLMTLSILFELVAKNASESVLNIKRYYSKHINPLAVRHYSFFLLCDIPL
jgi:hypothetical protein